MPEQHDDIAARSEEVHEILSYIPHWIIRWGITVILITVLMMILASWYVKYPDIIASRVTITTEKPPSRIMARASGPLHLFVEDDEMVKKGQLLALIDNPAKYEDVSKLEGQLNQMEKWIYQPDTLPHIPFDSAMVLGELQPHYSSFLQSLLAFRYFFQANYHARQIADLEKQIVSYRELNGKLKMQKEILEDELAIAKSNYDNDVTLLAQDAVAEIELKQSKSIYLQKKFSLENADISMIRNDIQIKDFEKNINDLKMQFRESSREYEMQIRESMKQLRSQIDIWKQQYLFIAPFDGQVSFFRYWSNDQFVTAGEELMNLIPQNEELIGKIYLPGNGAGKVKTGQDVRIKFDSYPFNEFGAVEGRVEKISKVSHDNLIVIDISLKDGLTTNYKQKLVFRQQMQGTADIITDDLRLIERIFSNLRSIFNQNKQPVVPAQ